MTIIDFIKNEKEKGDDEQILKKIIKQYPEKEGSFNEALKRGASATRIIQEIIRQNSQPPPEKEQKEREEQIKEIEEAKKRIEILKQQKEKEVKAEAAQEKGKEELFNEFLKRKAADEELEEKQLAEEKGAESQSEEISPLPRKKDGFTRSLIRFLIKFLIFTLVLFVLTAVLIFLFYNFVWQPQSNGCKSNSDCPEGYSCNDKICVLSTQTCSSDENCQENKLCDAGICKEKETVYQVSPSLFAVDDTVFLEITSFDTEKSLLFSKVQEWINADNFKRIVVVRRQERKELTLKEFFDMLEAKAPEELFQKLENNFTFFVYSQIQGNRIGFAAKIKDYQNLEKLLKSKESVLETGFFPLFGMITTEKSFPKNKPFLNANAVKRYTGPNFRYKILTQNDLGFYYLATDQKYFIFTTSWKSIEKVIEKLNIISAAQ